MLTSTNCVNQKSKGVLMKRRTLLTIMFLLVFCAPLLAANQGETMKMKVDRYIWDHPRYNIAYVDVEHGLNGDQGRSYTVETKMGEAICYFRGSEKSKKGSVVIAENRDGCRLKLDFNHDRSAVTVSRANNNCAICGEGMNLVGTYQFYKTYMRDIPAYPAPSPTTKID